MGDINNLMLLRTFDVKWLETTIFELDTKNLFIRKYDISWNVWTMLLENFWQIEKVFVKCINYFIRHFW